MAGSIALRQWIIALKVPRRVKIACNSTACGLQGAGDAFVDVSQARVDVMIDTVGNQAPNIRAGSVRALTVLSKERSPNLPDVPTLAESGLTDFDESGWVGFAAPANVPPHVMARLNKEIVAALQSPICASASTAWVSSLRP